MKTTTYLVKLRPLDYFFFGSEKGFKNYSNQQGFTSEDDITYYLQSRKFPQQTSVLGMLRKEILVQENMLKPRRDYSETDMQKMNKRIGKESFKIDSPGNLQAFGDIKGISPILIWGKEGEDEAFYIPVPKDHKDHKDQKAESESSKYTPLEFSTDRIIRTNLGDIQPFKRWKDDKGTVKSDYDPKKGLGAGLMNLKTKMVIPDEKVFCGFEKVGNNLNLQEDGYYKQKFFTLSKEGDFHFAFYLKTSYAFKDSIVYLGKEKSAFQMTFEERNEDFQGLISSSELETDSKVILLSDCYLPKETQNLFTIRSSISFRNLRGLQSMGRIKKKYNFWERGSVIYIDKDQKKEAVLNLFKKYIHLHQIGYNHVI